MSYSGKSHRDGLTLVQHMDMFPDDAAARESFETVRWGSDLEPAPIDDRHVLSEIGLSGHEIRQILPFRASSDACGPVWKIK